MMKNAVQKFDQAPIKGREVCVGGRGGDDVGAKILFSLT